MKKNTKIIIGLSSTILCGAIVIGGVATLNNYLNDDTNNINIDNINGYKKIVFNSNEEKEIDEVYYTKDKTFIYKIDLEPNEANNYDFVFSSSSENVKVVENTDGISCSIEVLTQFNDEVFLNIKDLITNKSLSVELEYSNFEEEKVEMIVCYYFDNIEDVEKRIVINDKVGQEVNLNDFKNDYNNYIFEKVSGFKNELCNFKLEESCVINFYYITEGYSLTCEYYKDGVVDYSLTSITNFSKDKKIYISSFVKQISGYHYDGANYSDSFILSEDTVLKLYYSKVNDVPDIPEDPDIPTSDFSVNGDGYGTYEMKDNSVIGNISGSFTVYGYTGNVYLSFSSSFNKLESTIFSVKDGLSNSYSNQSMTTGGSGSSGFAGGAFNTNGGQIYVFSSDGEKLGSFTYYLTNITEQVKVTGSANGQYEIHSSGSIGTINGSFIVSGYSGKVYLSFSSNLDINNCSVVEVIDGKNNNIVNQSMTTGGSGSSGFAGGAFNTNGGLIYVFSSNSTLIGTISYTMENVTEEISVSGSANGTYIAGNAGASGNITGYFVVEGYGGGVYVSFSSIFDKEDSTRLNVTKGVKYEFENETMTSGGSGSSGFAGGAFNTVGGNIYVYDLVGNKLGSFSYTMSKKV